tara:strand:- start:2892 stop:4631 length:1740 start_codon:yes stop_codon:yes gene_type:complete
MLKKGVLIVLFTILLTFSVSAATNFSAQDGYDWLANEVSSDGSFNSDVFTTALAILALDDQSYDTTESQDWLISEMEETDFCLPGSSCTIEETAATVLAFNELQDETYFDSWESWFSESLDNADTGGTWALEVVTTDSGTCTLSYEIGEELKEVDIEVEEGTFPSCDNSNFLDLDECVQSNLITTNPGLILDVDCSALESSSVVLTLVYTSDSTFFIIDNQNSDTGDFQINNGCFGKTSGASCNLDSSLWAGWALSLLNSDINTLIYMKETYDDTDPFQSAMLYLSSKDESYLEDLTDSQKSDGSFDRNVFTTSLAVLALSDSTDYNEEVEDAKSFLREEQSDEGHWGESVTDTAIALYGAFADEDVTASEVSSDDGEADECEADSDCEELYGDTYTCQDGLCSVDEETSTDGCESDDDCDSGNVCLEDGSCVESECNYDGTCEYPQWDETSYSCASDCYCGDNVCDDYEESEGTCSEDCGEVEEVEEEETEEEEDTSSSSKESDEGGSGLIVFLIIFLLLIGIGAGGFFAYKKGMLDSILDKFNKGPKGPSGGLGTRPAYKPFTNRATQQPGQNLFKR